MVVDTFAENKPRPRVGTGFRGGPHQHSPRIQRARAPLRCELHAPPRLVPLLARLRSGPRPRGPRSDSRARPGPRPRLPPLAAPAAQPHADPRRGRRPAGAARRPGGRGRSRRPRGRGAGPSVELRLLSGVDPQLAPPQRVHGPRGHRGPGGAAARPRPRARRPAQPHRPPARQRAQQPGRAQPGDRRGGGPLPRHTPRRRPGRSVRGPARPPRHALRVRRGLVRRRPPVHPGGLGPQGRPDHRPPLGVLGRLRTPLRPPLTAGPAPRRVRRGARQGLRRGRDAAGLGAGDRCARAAHPGGRRTRSSRAPPC
jgi:hypothetical protein